MMDGRTDRADGDLKQVDKELKSSKHNEFDVQFYTTCVSMFKEMHSTMMAYVTTL